MESRRSTPKALVLGMVYSTEMKPKRGQEFRDRVRCEALETIGGYEVFSLDNKHFHWDLTECREKKHCTSNFCDARRMIQSVAEQWGPDIQFDTIILDYFFSPVSHHQLFSFSLNVHILVLLCGVLVISTICLLFDHYSFDNDNLILMYSHLSFFTSVWLGT